MLESAGRTHDLGLAMADFDQITLAIFAVVVRSGDAGGGGNVGMGAGYAISYHLIVLVVDVAI